MIRSNIPKRRSAHRADHVGSLLRPAAVQKAREAHFPAADLNAIEDEGVRELVALQKSVGLTVFTDGEARPAFWHYDFMGMLTGLDMKAATRSLVLKTDLKTPPR